MSERLRAERAAIADRIEAYCKEHETTPRKLSLACGWDGSHLGTVLRRLRIGRDVRRETIITIAREMGRPREWLETGTMPEGIRVGDLPEWPALAEELATRLRVPPERITLIAESRLPMKPTNVAAFMLLFSQAWAVSS